jgi:hypothetical protein
MARERSRGFFAGISWVEHDDGRTESHQDTYFEGGEYRVSTTWARVHGRVEPVMVTVCGMGYWDVGPDGVELDEPVFFDLPITATVLRRLPIGTLHERAREDARNATREDEERGVEAWPGLTAVAGAGPRRGRPLGDDDLAEVAAVYRQAWFEQPKGGVIKAVAKRFVISEGAAEKRIAAARKAHLLDGIGRKR